MTIDDLKRAIVEVRELCWEQAVCAPQCPLFVAKYGGCPMKFTEFPEEWAVADWKEDGKVRNGSCSYLEQEGDG